MKEFQAKVNSIPQKKTLEHQVIIFSLGAKFTVLINRNV